MKLTTTDDQTHAPYSPAACPAQVTATEYKTREAWLAARQGSTGASAAAAMFDLGFQTKLQAYAVATGAMAPPEETEAMRMGHVMQPVIRDLYEAETGHKTQDWGDFTILRNSEFPNMHVTLDYPILVGSGFTTGDGLPLTAPAVLECKNVGHWMVPQWADGEIPIPIQMQVQQQLAVTGWEWGAVAAILAGGAFVWAYVERDEDFIQTLASRVEEFWHNVKNGTPPEPTADDAEALRALFPQQVEGKTVQLDADLLLIAARREANKMIVKELGECIDEDTNLLKAAIGDAEFGEFEDGTRYSCKRKVTKAHQRKESVARVLLKLKAK